MARIILKKSRSASTGLKLALSGAGMPIRDCRKELKPRPLHTIFGDKEAIAKMEQEFPNHWHFHTRRRYGKTAKDHASGKNTHRKNVRYRVWKGVGGGFEWVKG